MGHVTKGLRFQCIGCGDCCRRPGEVRFDDETFEGIAKHLRLSLEEFRQTYHVHFDPNDKETWIVENASDEACPFLVEDRCSIHSVRPRQCRTYPFWPEILESRYAWRQEKKECPGIGIGPLFDPDIVRQLCEAEENQLPVSCLTKVAELSAD